MTGRVRFVGAGPGRAGWITTAGLEAVRAADVVVTDALVSPVILAEARWDAEVRDVGKRGGRTSVPQEAISELLVDRARAGRDVVRLKGGDPTAFGRLAEELHAVEAAEIDFAIVPGVTAAAAAAARVGIPLTDRDLSASVTLLTGHRRSAGPRPEMDWQAAARSGTVVVYMGIRQAADSAEQLLAAGVPPATPVAVVRWAGTAKEAVWRTRLDELGPVIAREGIRPPAVWILGGVAGRAGADPRNEPPVRGTVALFRPEGSDPTWPAGLEAAGWEVLWCPLQRTAPPSDGWAGLRAAPRTTEAGSPWVAVSSPRAAAGWLAGEAALGRDIRDWAGAKVAAVGPATERRLGESGIRCAAVAGGSDGADGLVAALGGHGGGTVVLLQAEDARPGPGEELAAAGWTVHRAPTHRKETRPLPPPALAFALDRDWLQAAVWTSASQVRLLADLGLDWSGVDHIAFGDQTTAALEAAGMAPAAVAEAPTLAAVRDALDGLPA